MTPPLRGPIGFIGLGLLGQAMALRLAQQGVALVVWNREPERLAPLAAAGATVAASPREVAERCAVVCLCVLDGGAVRAVVFGTDGMAQAAPRERVVVVDFSTVDPQDTRAIAAQAAGHGSMPFCVEVHPGALSRPQLRPGRLT